MRREREMSKNNTPTIAELASMAGTKAQLAEACGVSPRTIGNWRSGDVAKIPFAAVVIMAQLASVKLADIKIEGGQR